MRGSKKNPKSLHQLRLEIAEIDATLLHYLAKRKECVEKIAYLKFQNLTCIRNAKIEKQVCERNKSLAKKLGLNKDFVKTFSMLVIFESLKTQLTLFKRWSRE